MTWPPSTLSVLVWTPAFGAVLSAFLVEGRLRRRIAIGFAGVSLALAAAIAIPFDSGTPPRELLRWVPSLGLSYDLFLDGFGSLLVLWIALLTFLALVSSDARERRTESLVLVLETALLGVAMAGDAVLFLSFYGAGLLAATFLLGRAEEMKTFLVFQTAGAALAAVSIAVSYHVVRVQTGFPSAEIARFSSLVIFPDSKARMLLLGGAAVALAAPLFPFASWVRAREIGTEGRLVLLGGWSLAGTLLFARTLLPAYSAGSGSAFLMVLAALSLLYAGFASRLSHAALLVGFQGLVVLGLLSHTPEGIAAGRAGMLQFPIALSAILLWSADSEGPRRPSLTSAIAIALVLPASWLVLQEHWNDARIVTALSGLGLVLMIFQVARALPTLSRKRTLLVLPLLALWAFTLLAAPSRFLPGGSSTPSVEEE